MVNEEPAPASRLLDPGEQQQLLALARRALEARVRREGPPVAEARGVLAEPRGAFVTLHRHGHLRGCLGQIEPAAALADTVIHLAGVVSDSDPRFEPVAPQELSALDLEISVLTPEREIHSPDEIVIGRHGLIVEQGARRGLLLPQVASEQGWGPQRFLEQTCVKAGLAPDAWRHGATVQVFEAQVFGESGRA